MKKLVTSLLIVVLLFNFIFCQKYFVLAEDDEELRQHKVANESMVLSNTVGVELMEEGAVSQKQGSATKTTLIIGAALGGLGACISGLLTRLINIFVVQIDLMIGAVTISEETRDGDADDHFWFTIDRCVFNRIPLFNINYFHTGDYYVGETKITTSGENQAIKEGIATAYQISRMLAIIMSLLVLIYIGIRMALSTVASEQAKYKKMLVSWIESVIILFCTVYIISAIITFGEVITSMLYEIRVDMIESGEGYDIFENTIRKSLLSESKAFEQLMPRAKARAD